ncbi:phytanoyl-CoA dioxygenase family protein [Ramlibacter albus]|uniref:Phytanoyl-CoA dioxygenase family protein n=1 Tax=Ramlibacter albus TaxID=2079448 RepID=A0A923MAN5_9BURK|nr:phytanoyl-CoA dioxygenase family protein [Ramlibacter albus]MBC5766938.1 phytanoyl-CoA dioxygenase family protein [Ramlibacter albus]
MPILNDLQRFSSPGWWREFAPSLHVEDADFLAGQAVAEVDPATAESLRAAILKEGYFQLPPERWQLPIAGLAEAVQRLSTTDVPLPFSFVYDEFWCLYFRLNKLIEAVLGPGFQRLPDFWAWLVNPETEESGWAPHRDKGSRSLFPDGSPQSITIWLPLTDATPLNGCMYVVPADRDPVYGTPRDGERTFRYQDIRALPASAGSILCWNQALLHWGSRSCGRASGARVSVAFEFQAGGVPPFNEPLTNPYEIPGFDLRVRLIGKQLLQYTHMYPLSPQMQMLARILTR